MRTVRRCSLIWPLPGSLLGGVVVFHRQSGVRRTRTPDPYNVLWCERVKVGGRDFDWFVCDGSYRAVAAVYLTWSRSFLFTLGLPPLCDMPDGRLGWSKTIMGFIEKALPSAKAAGSTVAAKCAWLAKQCPALHEFLTVSVLPGGETRTPSTVTIFTEGGLFKACLSEKDADVNLFASGEGLEACLDNLEERLTAQVVDWRRKGGGGSQKPARR